MRIRLNWTRLCVAIAGFLSVCSVLAQAYPSKSIRLVVPFPPGGAVDFYARAVQPALAEALGQPVVIDNKAGASGMLGAGIVAQSAPDGYTLMLSNSTPLSIGPFTLAKLPYDHITAFEPVITVGTIPHILVVGANQPFKTVADLLAAAKAQPGKLAFASGGNGTMNHLVGQLLVRETGVLFVHGEGFGQKPGTRHFRVVFLPNSDDMVEAFGRMAKFMESFGNIFWCDWKIGSCNFFLICNSCNFTKPPATCFCRISTKIYSCLYYL